jgi:hypothetical protein
MSIIFFQPLNLSKLQVFSKPDLVGKLGPKGVEKKGTGEYHGQRERGA